MHFISRNPHKAHAHPWLVIQYLWQRTHVDHPQFGKRTLLVMTLKCILFLQLLLNQQLIILRLIFVTHGLPMTLASDNSTPFQSTEFSNFMKANGVVHRCVLPFHPSSNGLAENMVKIVNQSLSKNMFTKDTTVETHIARFLASYHNTCHSTTARTPAELLFNRAPRTHLSLVHPCTPQCLEHTLEKASGISSAYHQH